MPGQSAGAVRRRGVLADVRAVDRAEVVAHDPEIRSRLTRAIERVGTPSQQVVADRSVGAWAVRIVAHDQR